MNPADYASRGLGASDFLKSSWIHGPEFLWKSESRWPPDIELLAHNPEVKRAVTLTASAIEKEVTLEDRLKFFSNWHSAKTATPLCLVYVARLHERVKKIVPTVEDIKAVQAVHFQKEIESQRSCGRNPVHCRSWILSWIVKDFDELPFHLG